MRISPMDGHLQPVASFMKVDLPQPEGPTMAMNSPAAPAGRWLHRKLVLARSSSL